MQAVEESHTCEETKVMENKNIRRFASNTLMGRRTASQTAQVHSGKPNAEQAAWNAEVERKKQLKKEGTK